MPFVNINTSSALFMSCTIAASPALALDYISGDCELPFYDFYVRIDEKKIELLKDVSLLGPENLIDQMYFDKFMVSDGKISIVGLPVDSFVIDTNANSVTADGETYSCKFQLVGASKSKKGPTDNRDEAVAQVERLIKDYSITAADLSELTVLKILKPLFDATK